MANKQLMPNQHVPLHFIYGEHDCCLCKENLRVVELENAIRKHRDQRGDDRCWMDDEELYKVLPEGYETPKRDTTVELNLCRKFIENRHNPNTEYTSPERRIEILEDLLEQHAIPLPD